MRQKNKLFNVFACMCLLLSSCSKFLDKKQDQSLVIPETIQDLQAIFDNFSTMNLQCPSAGELSSDDYYIPYDVWQSSSEYFQRMYIWAGENIFQANAVNNWTICYRNIYRANVVLDNIDKVKRSPNDQPAWNNTAGCGYFFRGMYFAQVAWIWASAYDKNTAPSKLGIPLRIDPNFNTASSRSTLEETYKQIIDDLKRSAFLLPETPLHVMRPSKGAAYGWLSRVYLSMREYDSAFIYANKYLESHNELMDFNTLNPASNNPIASYNKEVVFQSVIFNNQVNNSSMFIDSMLYSKYHSDDLRRQVFFRANSNGRPYFKGSYDGTSFAGNIFNGISTNEILITRAECYARLGNKDAAISDLNSLMVNRWRNNGSWSPYTASSLSEALSIILLERRKELVQRGVRWIDIKRLNMEGANIKLQRIINSDLFELLPNDPKFALPIPEDVIAITGMEQN